MARATTSFPEPLAPSIRTVAALLCATLATTSRTWAMAGEPPTRRAPDASGEGPAICLRVAEVAAQNLMLAGKANTVLEPLVGKHFNSAFEQTALEAELATLSTTHLVLAGAESSWCIRATAYAALERGYDLTLVKDAHTTVPMALADGRRIEPAQVVDELNIAMTWLRYPGRRNATATAEEVDFGGAAGAAR